ncbi:hypothetical protein PENTCL1PPCAC_761, partial [Pristionchus entomophagus]
IVGKSLLMDVNSSLVDSRLVGILEQETSGNNTNVLFLLDFGRSSHHSEVLELISVSRRREEVLLHLLPVHRRVLEAPAVQIQGVDG